jgi:hypothetical protein
MTDASDTNQLPLGEFVEMMLTKLDSSKDMPIEKRVEVQSELSETY